MPYQWSKQRAGAVSLPQGGGSRAVASNSSYALLGMLASGIGTFVGLALVPEQVGDPVSLRWPAVALAMGACAVPIVRALHDPRTLLRAEHAICMGLVYWLLLDLIQGVYAFHEVPRDSLKSGLFAVGLTAFGLWAGLLLPPWRPPKVITAATHVSNIEQKIVPLILLFFSLGILNFLHHSDYNVVTMIQAIGLSRWAAPWSRGQMGGWDAFLEHLVYFGYVLPTLVVVLARIRGWSNPLVWFSAALALLMIALLAQGGGRRVPGVIIGAALVTWILLNRRVGPKAMLVGTGAVAGLLVFLQVMLIYRGVGLAEMFARSNSATVSSFDKLRVDDNFNRLSQVIQYVPEQHPFVHEKQLIFILVRPIPRVFWPGKPTDPGFDLPGVLGASGVSLSTSMIGEWYLCAGWWTVLLGGYVFGRLCAMWNVVYESSQGNARAVLYAFGLMALFAGLRSLQDLVLMSYVVLVWIIGTRLVGSRSRYVNNEGPYSGKGTAGGTRK